MVKPSIEFIYILLNLWRDHVKAKMNEYWKILPISKRVDNSVSIVGKNYLNISTNNGGGNYNITIYRTIIDEILIRNSLNANLNPACQFNYESLKRILVLLTKILTKYA